MKVIILGPVLNSKRNGGVATIDESLVYGFRENGDEANIISLDKSDAIDNIVVPAKKYGTFSIIRKLSKMAKIIGKEKPDLVISSLQYNLGIKKFKKKCPTAKYVTILHGMAKPINGRLKAFAVNYVARYSCKHFDVVSTVSYISQAINANFYKIKCNTVIPNGILTNSINPVQVCSEKREFDFIYVGRLFRDKRVDMIADGFIKLLEKNNNLKLAIVGGGEMAPLFQKGGKYNSPNICYFGQQNHEKVYEFFRRSKIFISLNELEPLATTMMEAAINGCNIITPVTSGVTQLFLNDPAYHNADISSVDSLADDMERALADYCPPTEERIAEYKERFSAKRMAERYADLVKHE